MKNKKGFTLVELLAAIVILGILSVFALPTITRMFESSRNKMYVSDAKKLISLVEYRLKASSTTIDKPDNGNCIVVGMRYLSSSDFDSAPNGGEYEINSSYVVVKNNGGKLEYSAMLVEHLKSGEYRGVPLTKNSDLLSKTPQQIVATFETNELVDVDSISKTYINKTSLGTSYLTGSIEHIYNYPDLVDHSTKVAKDSTPKIESADITSKSSKPGSLDTVLTLKVTDTDTPTKNLKVYISFDDYSTSGTAYSYGDSPVKKIDIDLSSRFNNVDGGQAHIYITVVDPEKNEAKKSLTYPVRANEAPVINKDKSSIAKRDQDIYEMLTATVKLSVEDDLDDLSNLEICTVSTTTNTKPTGCSNYVKYYNLVNKSTNSFDYKFENCGKDACSRNGSTLYLTVFVKDSNGKISSEIFPYKLSKNTAPIFTEDVVITSKEELYGAEGSTTVYVTVRAVDDVDDDSQLKVTISNGETGDNKSEKIYAYSSDPNKTTYEFPVSNSFDGKTRKITVTVTDSEGASTTFTENYKVHLNTKPVISFFDVSSHEYACVNSALCPLEEGGNTTVDISLGVTDDIDSEEDILVCISETVSTCDSNQNYHAYKDYEKFQYTFNTSYDGSTKKLYVRVKDSQQLTASDEVSYKIYKNKKPNITQFEFRPNPTSFTQEGTLDTNLVLVAEDDFDKDDSLTFTLKQDGEEVLTNIPLDYIYEVGESDEVDEEGNKKIYINYNYLYTIGTQYDGSTHNFEVVVNDSDGLVSDVATTSYELYTNQAPTAALSPRVVAGYNPYSLNLADVYFYSNVMDDIDDTFTVTYCYKNGTKTECTDPISSTGNYHITQDNLLSKITSYSGQTLKFYAVLKDSQGESITTEEVSYTLFKDQSPEIVEGDASYDTSDYDSENDVQPITVSFSVKDYLDSYQACISETTTCSDYSSSFDGNTLEYHELSYNLSGEVKNSTKLTIFIKDKAGNVVKKQVTPAEKKSCSLLNKNKARYEYTAVSGKDISISKCKNQCYAINPITGEQNTVTGQYTRKITYYDRFNSSTLCSAKALSSTITVDCSFKDCFYANNNYKRKAIGLFKYDSEPWTYQNTETGEVYLNSYYYKVYESSYKNYDEKITLQETESKACDANVYSDTYNGEIFVRVADNMIG